MNKLSLTDLPLKNRRLIMRVDFNVPLKEHGEIADDSRIKAALPSIEYALKEGAKLILMSHLGRPEGKKEEKLSLAPIAKRLSELLKKPVAFASDCIGKQVKEQVDALKNGDVLLLENLRFHIAEEHPEQDPSFVSSLKELGDFYVNDAFGTAHRAHSSTALLAKKFPGKAAAGFLMEKEISHLSTLLFHPSRPFYAILGGAKVSTKAGVIHNLLKKTDALFIGGKMAHAFLKAKGAPISDPSLSASEIDPAKEILAQNKQIYLPEDLVLADKFANDAKTKIVLANEGIPAGWLGMDIGPKTIEKWTALLAKAASIFWNGPLGVFEMKNFALGTEKILRSLANTSQEVIIGGGDSVAAVVQMGLQTAFSHLSTGGGASLEFLEYGHLPGIDALTDK